LHYWAKQDDPEKYQELMNEQISKQIEKAEALAAYLGNILLSEKVFKDVFKTHLINTNLAITLGFEGDDADLKIIIEHLKNPDNISDNIGFQTLVRGQILAALFAEKKGKK
jgi:hypothetical protein